MKVKTITNHYFESEEHGSFPIPFDGEFRTEKLVVTGNTAKLGVVVQDEDCDDPFDALDEDGTQFYQFDRSRIHNTEKPEIDEFKRIIRANPGRVFTLETRGYGDFFVSAGPFSVKDTKGKGVLLSPAEQALNDADGYYIAPSDTADPRKYTDVVLEEYNNWCIGECFGVCVWKYVNVGTEEQPVWELQNRDNEVWGFIGEEYAEQELEEQMSC